MTRYRMYILHETVFITMVHVSALVHIVRPTYFEIQELVVE